MPPRFSKRFLAVGLVVLALAAGSAFGLNPAKQLHQYIHQRWTTENGLPANSVTDITQTRDGYIWVGTESGLARFDGAQFEIFNKASGQLPADYISCLFAASDGSLWIGTTGGVLRYEANRFQLLGSESGLSSLGIADIAEDRKGVVWISTTPKIFRYEAASLTQFDPSKDFGPSAKIVSMTVDSADDVWVVLRGGIVCRLRGDHFEPVPEPPEMTGQPLYIVSADPEGGVWVSSRNGGAYNYRDGHWIVFAQNQGLPGWVEARIIRDRDRNVWLGTNSGLGRIVGAKSSFFAADGRDIPGQIDAVYEDREGDLWLGSDGQGLHRLTDGAFTAFGPAEGLPEIAVSGISEDFDQNLLVGTNHGLYKGRDQFTQLYKGSTVLTGDFVFVSDPRDGSTWIGSTNGLFHRQGDSLIQYTRKDGLPSEVILALCLDDQGVLWIGGAEVTCLKDGRFFLPEACRGIIGVQGLVKDHEGNIWIGTFSGVIRYKGGTVTRFSKKDGLGGEVCLGMGVDSKGTVWVATENGGLSRYDNGRFFTYWQKDGLPSDDIYAVVEDPVRGDLWLGANRVYRINEKQLEQFRAGRIKHLDGTSFSAADGLKSPDIAFNGKPNAVRTSDGRLWWATGEGVAVVDPNHLILHNDCGPVVIKGIIADDAAVSANHPILPPGTRRLQINYAALTFATPQKVRFRYRLDGVDRRWFEAGQLREALFTRLGPGDYRFRVEASGDGGTSWPDPGAEATFTIRPYFYQTGWFLALCALAAVVLIYIALMLRRRHLEARFQAVLAERVRVAGEIHDSLAQGFASAAILLDSLDKGIENNSPLRPRLKLIRSTLGSSLAEARSMIAALRGQPVAAEDFELALRRLIERLSAVSPVPVTLDFNVAKTPMVSVIVQQQMEQVCREATTNAIRHANARHILVSLQFDAGKCLRLKIRDDGRGFDVPALSRSEDNTHFGLIGLAERAKRIGAELKIRSQPGHGTEVELVVPLARRDRRSGWAASSYNEH